MDVRLAGFNGDAECFVNLGMRDLIRLPRYVISFARFPGVGTFLASVHLFEFVGRSGRAPRIDAILERIDDGSIPGRMEISGARARFHHDAVAAQVCVCGGVQGLVNIADHVD